MQISRRAAHDEERLACREPVAVGSRACDFAAALFGDASRHRYAREHARLAREEFHLALFGTNAQNLAREVNIWNVFGNELVDSRIGYAQHVFPLMRLQRNNYSCFRIAVPVACARPLMRNDRRRPSRTRARNTVVERWVVIDPAANTGFRCGMTPYPRRRHEISIRNVDRQPSQKTMRKTPWNPLQQAFAETPRTKAWPESFAEALDRNPIGNLSESTQQKRSAENATMGPHCRLSSPNWQKTPQWGPP